MARLWRYQPVSDEWTTYHVQHPEDVVVSTLGTIDGYEWFVAEDNYVPSQDLLTFEEVEPTEEVQALLLSESPHAQLLTRRMQEGPPRYSADAFSQHILSDAIVIPSALTAAQIQQLYNALKGKYSL